MPIIKSAKKRVRVTKKASIQNSKTKKQMRTSIKKFQAAISSGSKDTTDLQNEAYSAIDTAAKKGIISKNKAARKKSQLNANSKQAGTNKPGKKSAKTTAKKPVKKEPAKKTTAKKPVKKEPAKKTTAKK